MLKRVVYVALLVSDQDKALDYYTNVMGLEKRGDYPHRDTPRFLTVGVKGQDFELALWPGTPARGEAGSVYTIEVEDCRISQRGSRIRTGIRFNCERVGGRFGSEGHRSRHSSQRAAMGNGDRSESPERTFSRSP